MRKIFTNTGMVFILVLGLANLSMAADSDSLVVNDSGFVGIGTDSPEKRLHVKDATALFDRGVGGSNVNYTFGSRAYKYTFEGHAYNLLLKGKDSCPIFGVDRINGSVDNPQPLADNDEIFNIRTSGTNASGTQTFHYLLRVKADGDATGDKTLNQKLGLLDDKVMIRSSGKVGIGTTAPNSILSINGSCAPTSRIEIKRNDAGTLYLGSTGGSGYIQTPDANPLVFYTNSNEQLRIGSSGNVGIGTSTPSEKLHVAGNVLATAYNTSSDIRWKQNIEAIGNATEILTQLRGVAYDWIDPSRGEGRQIGVIAQEVEQVLPEIVHTDSQGYKSVEYAKLVAPLIEAVKELKAELEDLRDDNEQLLSENQTLKQANQTIEARMAEIERLLLEK